MVMTITNFWKLFRYGVKRYYYEKLIGIREFLERLDQDLFRNPFSTDTRTPGNKIPPLDEADDRETVSAFRALHFPVVFTPPQQPALFLTYLNTVLHQYLLDLSIILKEKNLDRREI